jgi:hypothetical protein
MAGGGVQRHPIGRGVTGSFKQVLLNSAGERSGVIRVERISALPENSPQTIFFVRHACCAMAGAGLSRRAVRLLRIAVASHRNTDFRLSEAHDEHASKVEMPLFVIEI